MTFGFRLRLAWMYFLGFITNGVPIYIRHKSDSSTSLKLARWRYDPWTDTRTFVVNHQQSELVLHNDGKIDDYNSMRWMYVSKSKRTMQKLQNS